MAALYPLKLSPSPSERLWGGTRLREFVPSFKDLKTADPIGEAWLVYSENKIENGLYQGKTLQELASDLGESLLGSKSTERYGNKVPLLAKFIDADQALSIQVHPDDSYALSKEAETGHLGKVEAWYIMSAKPEASIIWGFKDELSHEEIRVAIKEGRLEQHLNTVPVKAGDVIFNPAGTVHAIGAGIFLFEIQQSSDLTYRLYDFNRRDAAGRLRDLHVDKALEVSDLSPGEHAKVKPEKRSDTVTTIVSSEHFVAEKWQISGETGHQTSASSLELITVLEGEIGIEAGGSSLVGKQADSFVLPAALGSLTLNGQGSIMRCYLA